MKATSGEVISGKNPDILREHDAMGRTVTNCEVKRNKCI